MINTNARGRRGSHLALVSGETLLIKRLSINFHREYITLTIRDARIRPILFLVCVCVFGLVKRFVCGVCVLIVFYHHRTDKKECGKR